MREVVSPYLAHSTSAAIVALASLAMLGAVLAIFARMAMHRQAAAFARVAASGTTTLRPGHTVLVGTVRTEHGGPAMTVRIPQNGKQRRNRGRTYHTWSETSREQHVERFDLMLETGEVVAVEPGEHVFLVDQLRVAQQSGTSRVMEAELSNGERAFVEGVLSRKAGGPGAVGGGDYRGGGGYVWTLRPPTSAPMLICTETLEGRHERRETAWRNTGIVIAGVFVLAQLFAFTTFWPLMTHGARCDAEISSLEHYVTRGSRGSRNHHYVVHAHLARCPQGDAFLESAVSDEVGDDTWSLLHEGDVVPFVFLPEDPSRCAFGDHAGLRPTTVFFGAAAILFMLLFAWSYLRRGLAWYEQRKVVHTGNGPL